MKKKFIYIFAFIFCLAGVGLLSFNDGSISFAETPEYNEILVNNDNFVQVMSASTTYGDESVKLTLQEDIDLQGDDISSIYETLNTFSGVFDGNGFEIKNITLSSSSAYYGLFPYARNATIENLRITGTVAFDFEGVTSPIIAGVLVGYGENVTIRNCELYNVTITSQEDPEEPGTSILVREENEITLPISSNFTFGGLIGVATSFTTVGEGRQSIIENCVNYYDFDISTSGNGRVAVGGIVGYLTNGSEILNCLNFGDISLEGTATQEEVFGQYIGGICGEIDGTGTKIKNTAYGGEISNTTQSTNTYLGTLVGYLNCPQASQDYNVNFSYWSQSAQSYYGTGYAVTSGVLRQVEVINQAFLSDSENFDLVESGFDFEYDWTMINSEILLQTFQTYSFDFGINYNAGIIENASFSVDGGQESSQVTARYGQTVTIKLNFTNDCVGYYTLEQVMCNDNRDGLSTDDYTQTPTTSAGMINGYEINLTASDVTDGTYTFSFAYISYSCEITVSDEALPSEALPSGQGTVKSTASNSRPTTIIRPSFSYNNRSLSVVANGDDVFTFDHWEILYADENGEFTVPGTLDDISEDATINIYYGVHPFNQRFKLVAYFTDDDAVEISIANFDQNMIESVAIRGSQYEGESIKVPFDSTNVSFIVVVKEGYLIDSEEFESYVGRLYGTNTDAIDGFNLSITSNDDRTTTYQFALNMRLMQEAITSNQLALNLYVEENQADNGDPLLWVYIVVPIVAVLIIGLVIFLIVRNKKGGGSGKSQAKKEKKKEENYRKYYI